MVDDLITPDTTDRSSNSETRNEYEEERDQNSTDQPDSVVDNPFTPNNSSNTDYETYDRE